MAILGPNKATLIKQLENAVNIPVAQVVKLLNTYEDLTLADLSGVVPQEIITEIEDSLRDPNEKQAFEDISTRVRSMSSDIRSLEALLQRIVSYQSAYPDSPKIGDANNFYTQVSDARDTAVEQETLKREREREKAKWESLNRSSYASLKAYKEQFPNSVHKNELDDLMWNLSMRPVNFNNLNRYLDDWPDGRHTGEANETIEQLYEWDSVRQEGELVQIASYYNKNKKGPLAQEIMRKFSELKAIEVDRMRTNPADYNKERINDLIDNKVFSRYELIDEGLMTDESFELLMEIDREAFPNLQELQKEDPNLQAPAGCTDIYLFGSPGTGKTCLLMGLAMANGKGYSLNMKVAGGPYASALQQYVGAGITPGRTYGQFVTVIHGNIINEITERGLFSRSVKTVNHPINLVEMSGEEFALRISENISATLADMGTGATNLLCNKNRKAFFIIIDCSKDKVKVEFKQDVMNEDGEVIDQVIRKRYISQLDILNKFVGLFSLPENQTMMKNVDSIHFVVTKSDLLADNPAERQMKAVQLLNEKYGGPVEELKLYCRRTKRINFSTDFKPHVFTFSLGDFYLGDVFTFKEEDTLAIVNAIRAVTSGYREKSFLDMLKEKLG